jgi:hypothetical protein
MSLDSSAVNPGRSPLAALRRFARPAAPARERCELCSAALAPDHQHLVEPSSRQLLCACEPCAILFSGREGTKYRRVPRHTEFLPGFRLTDVQWAGLNLPVNLAFFLVSTTAGGVLALYPSPGGATEALVSPEAWQELVADNPFLRDFEPDVEALLVNRVGEARECYRAGLDQCYKLVGLIRTHWRGMTGGTEVWQEVGRFFAALKERSRPRGGPTHA